MGVPKEPLTVTESVIVSVLVVPAVKVIKDFAAFVTVVEAFFSIFSHAPEAFSSYPASHVPTVV